MVTCVCTPIVLLQREYEPALHFTAGLPKPWAGEPTVVLARTQHGRDWNPDAMKHWYQVFDSINLWWDPVGGSLVLPRQRSTGGGGAAGADVGVGAMGTINVWRATALDVECGRLPTEPKCSGLVRLDSTRLPRLLLHLHRARQWAAARWQAALAGWWAAPWERAGQEALLAELTELHQGSQRLRFSSARGFDGGATLLGWWDNQWRSFMKAD